MKEIICDLCLYKSFSYSVRAHLFSLSSGLGALRWNSQEQLNGWFESCMFHQISDVTRRNSERCSSLLAKLKPCVFNPKMRNERSKKLTVQQEIRPNGTWNWLQQWFENSPLIHISLNSDCSYDRWLEPRGQIKGICIWFYILRSIVWLFTIVSVIKGCICSG